MKKLALLSVFLLAIFSVKAQSGTNMPLQETHWVLTNLNDKVVNKNVEGLESFIIFEKDNMVKGFAGCNRFQAVYKLEIENLKIKKVGATKMMCEKDNNEREYLKTIKKVVTFKIIGTQLVLKDKKKTIAIFEAKTN